MKYLMMKKNAVILFLTMVCGMTIAYAQSADGLPLRLRVAAYNVGHFNQGVAGGLEVRGEAVYGKEGKGRYAKMEMLEWRNWISQQNIDVLGVQEWNSFFDADSTIHAADELLSPFYNNVYLGEEHTWIHNGIVSNYTLTNLRQKYWAGDYYALIGDLKVGEKTITVVSTHVPWQQEWHENAIDSMLVEMQKYEYLICMGDMNAKDDTQLRFREEGFNMANGGHQGWFATASGPLILAELDAAPNRNIDNVITTGNIKIMNVSAPKNGLTNHDHLPIIADLIITW